MRRSPHNESFSSAQLQLKLLSLGVPFTKNLRNLQFEPVEVWLHLASKARAILSAAAALHSGKTVSAQDWNTLNEGFSTKVPVSIKKAKYSHFFLAEILNRWLEIGEVSLRMSGFDPDRIEVVGAGVLGSIARQLLFAVGRVDSLAFCNGCGTPFLPKRRPTQGRQSWCATCRKGKAPQRQAQRDYRARQLAKRHPDRLFKQKSGDA